MYEVRLKAGHPTGMYRRAGLEFTREPRQMEKVPKEIHQDKWLEVTEMKSSAPPGPFDGFTVEQLKDEAIKRKIELPGGLKKAEIVAYLVEHDAKQTT